MRRNSRSRLTKFRYWTCSKPLGCDDDKQIPRVSLCPPGFSLYLKKSEMNTFTKLLIGLWALLALITFAGSFLIPVMFFKVAGIAFGGLNILTILSWVISTIQAKREYKKLNAGE